VNRSLIAAPAQAHGSIACRLARSLVLRALARLQQGELVLSENGKVTRFGRPTAEFPHSATLVVRDPRFWIDVALGGNVGAGESYVKGRWGSDDVATLIRIASANYAAWALLEGRLTVVRRPLERLLHALRRNTIRGSRKNIGAHYDTSNEFFELFLDETLTYSCAVFPREDASLAEGSVHKLDAACTALDLKSGMRVLEIGGGWGGFALHAARGYGCQVVTTTVSAEQRRLSEARVRAAGLESRITVLEEDYRRLPERLTERFDAIVSVEMIEAVGHEYLPEFFRVCGRMLAPGGRLFLQAILLPDPYYERYRRSVDFIRKHVFPGGHLPSPSALRAAIAASGGLSIAREVDITAHYPKTLRAWRQRLVEHWDEAKCLGFTDAFLRLWEYYFAYCEGGFLTRSILVQQWLLRSLCEPRPNRQSA